ncbi:hypothetical protein C2G38_2163916 [Gigaspora rosea]|uniref:Uncharacterized protein n=1 Tax=Gigaspora rosea TaxID=44941 RepID=A0A397VWN6_9GLOM|nr:hypothetical protein C2G38_2163916 [Gigaspora rosea]
MAFVKILKIDVLKHAQSQPIVSVYPDQTSKKFAHKYTSIKNSDAINLHDNQIEVISFCNEDENHATNQDQDITSSNTQSSMKLLPLSPNPNILSPNINILSPDPNISDLDISSLPPNTDIKSSSSKSKTKKKAKDNCFIR